MMDSDDLSKSWCRPLGSQPDILLDVVPDVRGGVVVGELHEPVDHVGMAHVSGQAEQILVMTHIS